MLNVFVTVLAGLLAREMRYRPISLLSVLSTLVGGAVALALAFTGHGLWALALQRVAGVGFYALGTMVVTRCWPILAFDRTECREAVRFALPLMGSQALIALPGVVTMTVIGPNLGVEPVGQLRIAQRLGELMVQLVISPVMRVFIPVFSAMSDNRERLRGMLRRVIDALALPVLPMFAVAAVVAGPLTRLAFGPGWDVSASLFQILSLAAPLVVVSTVTWPTLVGIGRTGDVFRLKLFEVVITIAVALAASPFGVFAYVWASIGRAAVQLLASAWLLGRAAGQGTAVPLVQLVAPTAASAAGFAVGHWLVATILPPMHPVFTLAALAAGSGAVAGLALVVLSWSQMPCSHRRARPPRAATRSPKRRHPHARSR
jgi:O-antigen/teichoic acid export membrane protein